MRAVFLGCTRYSEELLLHLRESGNVSIEAIFSIPEEFTISYSEKKVKNSNYADLSVHAKNWNIPFFEVDSIPGKSITDYTDQLERIKPDVFLVLGWYYMVPSKIRSIARYGAWGIHASLLPKYAGGAPLVWAIMNGESETGVTLFRFEEGVDNGDIIRQQKFPIEPDDHIRHVYEKATRESKKLLDEVLSNPASITFTPQDQSKIEVFPQRSPEDGEIDLNWDSSKIYDFIRAQSSPYPGAFIKLPDGRKLVIEEARIV